MLRLLWISRAYFWLWSVFCVHVAIFYQSKMIDILKRPLDGHQISTVAELLDSGMVIGFPANFAVSTGGTFCKVAQKFPLWCYKFFHFGKKRRELERKKCFNFLIHHALNKPPKGTDRNFFSPHRLHRNSILFAWRQAKKKQCSWRQSS